VRQFIAQCAQYRQAADARVEHANRAGRINHRAVRHHSGRLGLGAHVRNSSTSRIEGESVKNITSRSTPSPRPAVGGMPYSKRADVVGVKVHRLVITGFLARRLGAKPLRLIFRIVELGKSRSRARDRRGRIRNGRSETDRNRWRATAATPRPDRHKRRSDRTAYALRLLEDLDLQLAGAIMLLVGNT